MLKRIALAVTAALLVICAATAMAAVSSGHAASDSANGHSGSLVVFLADSVFGAPLGGGYICIPGVDWMPGPLGAMWSAEVNALGWARLGGLPPGDYELGAGAFMHRFRSMHVQIAADRTDTLRIRLPFRDGVVPAGAVFSGGELHYRCGGRADELKVMLDGVAVDSSKVTKKRQPPARKR